MFCIKSTIVIIISISSTILITAQRIEYLNGLTENQHCDLNSGTFGRCRKISECYKDFEAHKRDRTILKVCSFASNPQSHLICCSQNFENIPEQTTKPYPTFIPRVDSTASRTERKTTTTFWTTTSTDRTTSKTERTTTRPTTIESPTTKSYRPTTTSASLDFRGEEEESINNETSSLTVQYDEYVFDLIDFESCRDGLLGYRNSWINTNHFGKALSDKIIPLNKENCDLLNKMNQDSGSTKNKYFCRSARGKYFIIDRTKRRLLMEEPKVKEGFRPNMAAIGWTLKTKTILYRCFGSIVTEKFIVTAAHCKDMEDLSSPDTVRVGDRYLASYQDDENAQQLRIQKFIAHPMYNPNLEYNDIAMIETVERIIFSNFVVPSCIGGINDVNDNHPTVSGYEDDVNGIPMNVLVELDVEIIPNSECNQFYGKDPQLPHGIVRTQMCVKSKATRNDLKGTCFGESGSPLQFKYNYDANYEDLGSDYIVTTHESSTLIGIQSFSTSCALDIPSVYTRIEFFKNWMKSIVENLDNQ